MNGAGKPRLKLLNEKVRSEFKQKEKHGSYFQNYRADLVAGVCKDFRGLKN